MADRVAVLLDYENVLRGGWELHGRGRQIYQCVPEPSLVADAIAAARGQASTVTAIYVFRAGRIRASSRCPAAPTTGRQRSGHAATRGCGWSATRLPTGTGHGSRPWRKALTSRWPSSWYGSLQEREQYEALVVFSGDTDLRPALDLCRKIGGAAIEVACWDGAKPLQIPKTAELPCHYLTDTDWRKVIRDWSGRA
ncbi:MAG TPA: hypothetical protein VMV92_36320 [Streptosporangiaceae bacterium]|nr:hypothetical protein [Streptosporangiaceae bacterium]